MLTEIKAPFITKISDPAMEEKGLELNLLRLDDVHPEISGNKWFKLKYNIEAFQRSGSGILVSCGGPWSNHIAALAAAAYHSQIPAAALIRGEEHIPLNPTLHKAREYGMKLAYVNRTVYRDKIVLEQKARDLFGTDLFWIPEGGSNAWGVLGCTEILSRMTLNPDVICCASGTGATVAGMAASNKGRNKLLAFPVLKGGGFIRDNIEAFSGSPIAAEVKFMNDYHFGGYGKVSPELIRFVDEFYTRHRIWLDYIYTGKMMFGIYDLAARGFFERGTCILAIHTGGVQGNAGTAINRGLFEIDP
ncbi:MAG TPA: pyridoxal-phosphate dependent enzyme [Bacteroidia bacterium]|jgi:1-aminocyclopropane-1-carboxylate deaminase|nr:pyridoxal-phosphate dependent enzyme [Bacteroidia bacterium]